MIKQLIQLIWMYQLFQLSCRKTQKPPKHPFYYGEVNEIKYSSFTLQFLSIDETVWKFCYFLCTNLNNAVSSSQYPNSLKCANITAIFKKYKQ